MRCPVCFVVMIETNKIRFKRFVRTSHNCNNLTCSWVVSALRRHSMRKGGRLTHKASYSSRRRALCIYALWVLFVFWRRLMRHGADGVFMTRRRIVCHGGACVSKAPYALWGRIAPLSQRLPHASMSSSSR